MRFAGICFYAILVYYIFPAALSALTAEEIIRQAENEALSAKTLAADFTLTITWRLRDTTEEKSGKFILKKPDQYRVELGQNLFISDGKTFWRFSKKNKQVMINNARDMEGDFQPGAWFFKYSDAYRPEALDSTEHLGEKYYGISLKPKTAAQFSRLKVWINEKSRLPGKIETTDKNENKAVYLISRIVKDTLLGPKLFKFSPPKGTEIIDLRE